MLLVLFFSFFFFLFLTSCKPHISIFKLSNYIEFFNQGIGYFSLWYAIEWARFFNFLFLGKLHFTTLNYTLDYTLHPKLFKCTIYTLNYDTYYTLHPDVSFTVILDETFMHMTCTCILLRWNKVKRQKYSSQSLKQKLLSYYFSSSLSHLQV